MKKYIQSKGITLVSLIITIIILLILAAVGIGTLGPGGLIEKAEEAKTQAQIDEEKEIVGASAVQSAGANRYGNIEKEELAIYVAKNAGNRDVEVIEDANKIYVNFKDTERYYEVGNEGEVSNPILKEEIEYAGDITKGGTLDGTVDKPYEIWCIEDLVAFSIMSNGGNTELGLASNTFTDKYVLLMRTLDFNSIFSYNDHMSTKYGDLNADGATDTIKTELTKTAEGCVGFTPISSFKGYFDGRGNEIQNIYIKKEGPAALFVSSWGAKSMQNIGVTGEITSTTEGAAGILVGGSATMENCWNKAKVTAGSNDAAGICTGGSIIKNCYNTGDVTNTSTGGGGYSMAGGITVGYNKTVENCYNTGEIKSGGYAGGIASGHGNGKTTVRNCYNTGNIQSEDAGGILGTNGETIENCYNTGNIKGISNHQFASGITTGATEIKNCYNTGNIKGKVIGGICAYLKGNITNCYNLGETTGNQGGGIAGTNYLYGISGAVISNCFNIADVSCANYDGYSGRNIRKKY